MSSLGIVNPQKRREIDGVSGSSMVLPYMHEPQRQQSALVLVKELLLTVDRSGVHGYAESTLQPRGSR